MSEGSPSHPKPQQARFVVIADVAGQWPDLLKARLKNPTAFKFTASQGAAKALDEIDETLKSAGKVDELILLIGSNDVRRTAWQTAGELAGLSRMIAKLAYRAQMYQPEGAQPPQVTLCTPTPVGSKAAAEYEGANPRIADLAKAERETALSVGTRLVDLYTPLLTDVETLVDAEGVMLNEAGQKRVAELIAAVFADRAAPQPPGDVKITGQKVTWTASPTKDVLGYEIHDVDDEATLLTTSVTTEATLPEGHDTCAVVARDTTGRVSEGGKPVEK